MSLNDDDIIAEPLNKLFRIFDKYPQVRKIAELNPKLNRSFWIPWFAGISRDLSTVYIDYRVPLKINVAGEGDLEHHFPCIKHETTEAGLMLLLNMDYTTAHHFANAREKEEVDKRGWNWDVYNRGIYPWIKVAEKRPPGKTIPPDLFIGTYREGGYKDYALLEQMQLAKPNAMGKYPKEIAYVNYRKGSAKYNCGGCKYYQMISANKCAKVDGVISPSGVCNLWESN